MKTSDTIVQKIQKNQCSEDGIFCLVLSSDFQWQNICFASNRIPETSLIQYLPKDTDLDVSKPQLIISENTQRTSVNTDIDLLQAAGLIDGQYEVKTRSSCSGVT